MEGKHIQTYFVNSNTLNDTAGTEAIKNMTNSQIYSNYKTYVGYEYPSKNVGDTYPTYPAEELTEEVKSSPFKHRISSCFISCLERFRNLFIKVFLGSKLVLLEDIISNVDKEAHHRIQILEHQIIDLEYRIDKQLKDHEQLITVISESLSNSQFESTTD